MNSNVSNIPFLLEKIDSGKVLLPEFQRNYVWGQKEILPLFDSILNDYPIGLFIIWKTTKNRLTKDKSEVDGFVDSVKLLKTKTENTARRRSSCDGQEQLLIILDGQQRLSTLYLVFKGKIFDKKNNELDLCYKLQREKDDFEKFEFVSINLYDMYKDEKYISLKDIYSYSSLKKLEKRIANYQKACKKDIKKIYTKFKGSKLDQLKAPHFIIDNSNYDQALDIFVKVNSTGKRLTKTDLLLSKLIQAYEANKNMSGKQLKNNYNNFIKKLNDGEKFKFDYDTIFHTSLVLVSNEKDDRKLNIVNMNNQANKIVNNFEKIKIAIEETRKFLNNNGLFDVCITSYNAIIPIAYYYYKCSNNKLVDDEKVLKQYFMRAVVK